LLDPNGRVAGLRGTLLDITERKRAEEEVLALNVDLERRVEERTTQLAEANRNLTAMNHELVATNEALVDMNRRLDEATRAKSEFLAAMSHDLRTPMNSILGFSGILVRGLAGPLNEEQHRQIGMINNSGKHLLELINGVLDLSRIEAGTMPLEISETKVAWLVELVAGTMLPLAREKGLELSCDVTPESGTITSDATRVEQILLNLLGNAVKFTDSGHVTISAGRDGSDHLFEISDTGCGIRPEEMERIFDDFYQGGCPGLAKEEGTGLGLAVARRIAEALGGSIGVESTVGEGSTFTLRLPAVIKAASDGVVASS
jgi:signal transduction histidine kinase